MTQGPQTVRRSYANAIMPVLPGGIVVLVRLLFGWILSRPTSKQPSVLEFNREFIAQTLVWALVSILTSALLRLAVDRRVLFTGSTAHFSSSEHSWHDREYKTVKLFFVVFIICAALDSARPGTMGFVWMIFVMFYLFALTYLSLGWLRQTAAEVE